MEPARIVLMKERRRELIPIEKIKVINSRERDEGQFALNVQSIDAQNRLGKSHIRAEVVTCSRKQAYLESLVENLARSRPGTMEFARELKSLHDEGWDYDRIARIACRTAEYIRHYIRLAENDGDRLIQGVEQEVFPISFAILVAQSDDASIQNVLMDAFDQGIVNCQNFAKARAIINARADRRKRAGNAGRSGDYTVATLTHDIANATQEKDSYVREAQGKESRLFVLLDGLESLWKDATLLQLLAAEGLGQRPELSGSYSVGATRVAREPMPSLTER